MPGGPDRGQSHHRRILEALARRNPAAGREAMRAHLEQARRDSEKGAGGIDPAAATAR